MEETGEKKKTGESSRLKCLRMAVQKHKFGNEWISD